MARSFAFSAALGVAAVSLIGATFPQQVAPGIRTTGVRTPDAFASRYTYAGTVYDRVLSVTSRSHFRPLPARHVPSPAATGFATAPYGIVDLNPIIINLPKKGFNAVGYGIPTAVNNSGHIGMYVDCECFVDLDSSDVGGTFSTVIDDSGHVYNIMLPFISAYALGTVTVYAVNNVGSEAGHWEEHDDGPFSGNQGWTDSGLYNYIDGAHGGDTALGINDQNRAVGRDYTPTGVFAASFSYSRHRFDMQSPQGSSCTGTGAPMATGINSSGQIVGYACNRATAFYEKTYARYLPVAPSGVSSAAQAINVHGDVVGSAGAQAFLYSHGRTTYLPRPAGETAGNAVAFAINANDEIVGDIFNGTTSTAFLYVNGKSYDLDALLPANSGWQITYANGINDGGQIVGGGIYAGEEGGFAGFSMKPNVTP